MILKDTEIRNNTIILKLEDGGTTEKIAMSVDDFYSFHLASGMEIGEDQLKEIKAAAEKTAVFAKCLHKLAAHDRSTKEMRTWLRDTLKVSSSLRQEILDKLTERGYLDDERYCREQIGMMKSALKGERLIQETLLAKGIGEEMIVRQLAAFHDEEDNARRYGEKILRARSKGSLRKAKDEIRTKLVQRGYSSAIARDTAEKLDYSLLEEDQDDNAKKALEKARRRYSRRYSGYELRTRLYRYGLQQGYDSQAVNRAIDEMETEHEEDQGFC